MITHKQPVHLAKATKPMDQITKKQLT